jgi:hypothetical protein
VFPEKSFCRMIPSWLPQVMLEGRYRLRVLVPFDKIVIDTQGSGRPLSYGIEYGDQPASPMRSGVDLEIWETGLDDVNRNNRD